MGQGAWVVHNCPPNGWINNLVNQRVIDTPSGVTPEDAVNAVYAKLRADYGADYIKVQSISVLEVNRKLYLGFNATLDKKVLGMSAADYAKIVGNGYPGMTGAHAERMALNTYYHDSSNVGRVGRMFTNREACFACIQDDKLGQVVNGVRATGLDRLDMSMRANSPTTGKASRWPHQIQNGKIYLTVTKDGWQFR